MKVSRQQNAVSRTTERMSAHVLVLLCLLATVLLPTVSLPAQQPQKIPTVGRLGASSASAEAARREAFRQGLRELGYIEGKNILIEWRHAEGKPERLSALADELVRLKVDVIVTGGGNATQAVKKATSTIPIVMAQAGDPVADGFVASLARPGANITGLSRLSPELSGKQLELLNEIVSKLSRVAVFGTSTDRSSSQSLREVERAAPAFGVKLHYHDVTDRKDYEGAFQAASKERAERTSASGGTGGARDPKSARSPLPATLRLFSIRGKD